MELQKSPRRLKHSAFLHVGLNIPGNTSHAHLCRWELLPEPWKHHPWPSVQMGASPRALVALVPTLILNENIQ